MVRWSVCCRRQGAFPLWVAESCAGGVRMLDVMRLRFKRRAWGRQATYGTDAEQSSQASFCFQCTLFGVLGSPGLV